MRRRLVVAMWIGLLAGMPARVRAEPPVAAQPAPVAAQPAPAAAQADPAAARRIRLKIAATAIGTGGALLALSAVFGFTARSAWNNVVKECGGTPERCPKPVLTLANTDRDYANRQAVRGDWLLAIGSAAIVAGGVLYLTAPDRPASQAVRLSPAVDRGAVGVVLSGVLR